MKGEMLFVTLEMTELQKRIKNELEDITLPYHWTLEQNKVNLLNLNLTVSSPDKLPQHFSIEIPDNFSVSEPVVHCSPIKDHALCDSENHGKIDLLKLLN